MNDGGPLFSELLREKIIKAIKLAHLDLDNAGLLSAEFQSGAKAMQDKIINVVTKMEL